MPSNYDKTAAPAVSKLTSVATTIINSLKSLLLLLWSSSMVFRGSWLSVLSQLNLRTLIGRTKTG